MKWLPHMHDPSAVLCPCATPQSISPSAISGHGGTFFKCMKRHLLLNEILGCFEDQQQSSTLLCSLYHVFIHSSSAQRLQHRISFYFFHLKSVSGACLHTHRTQFPKRRAGQSTLCQQSRGPLHLASCLSDEREHYAGLRPSENISPSFIQRAQLPSRAKASSHPPLCRAQCIEVWFQAQLKCVSQLCTGVCQNWPCRWSQSRAFKSFQLYENTMVRAAPAALCIFGSHFPVTRLHRE